MDFVKDTDQVDRTLFDTAMDTSCADHVNVGRDLMYEMFCVQRDIGRLDIRLDMLAARLNDLDALVDDLLAAKEKGKKK